MIVLFLCLAIVFCRRWRKACLATVKLERQNRELQELLAEIRRVQGDLPLCPSCKRVRDSAQNWHRLRDYLHDRIGTRFNHCVCPECERNLYPGKTDPRRA